MNFPKSQTALQLEAFDKLSKQLDEIIKLLKNKGEKK